MAPLRRYLVVAGFLVGTAVFAHIAYLSSGPLAAGLAAAGGLANTVPMIVYGGMPSITDRDPATEPTALSTKHLIESPIGGDASLAAFFVDRINLHPVPAVISLGDALLVLALFALVAGGDRIESRPRHDQPAPKAQ